VLLPHVDSQTCRLWVRLTRFLLLVVMLLQGVPSQMREFCWKYNRRRMQASIFDLALASMVSLTPLAYKTLVAF
jgi:hypothetical protein